MSRYKILYIFPHPDDETFGPAPVINIQRKEGHEIYLLTLTKGGATRERFKLNKSVDEMGEIRYREMLDVKKVLGLTDMTVLDLPDSGLQEEDPREIEKIIAGHIEKIKPDVVVTYPVHGNSGFHDHLVTHAVVKRVYLEMKDNGADYLKRLAFLTLKDHEDKPVFQQDGTFRMRQSPEYLIDCEIALNDDDIETLKKALSCYGTYKDKIEESGVEEKIGDTAYAEFYREDFDPPVKSITEKLNN